LVSPFGLHEFTLLTIPQACGSLGFVFILISHLTELSRESVKVDQEWRNVAPFFDFLERRF
jgi:hypothetical protein